MISKCRIPRSRTFLWLPIAPLVISLIYGVLYISEIPLLRVLAGDITSFQCLFFASILESCIQCGLIPSNTNYDELFRVSAIDAYIADADDRILLSTNIAKPLPMEILRSARQAPVMLDGRIRISSMPVKDGHVLWTDDVSELLKVLEELRDIQESMKDSNTLLTEEYRLKVREAHIAEQDRLHNAIQRQTARQIDLLSTLTNRFEQAELEEERARLLGQMNVIGAYLKRRNNLIFISDKAPTLDVKELELAFKESIDNLELYGVSCGFRIGLTGTLPSEHIMKLYDFFEEIVERSLDSIGAIHVAIEKREHCLQITVNIDSTAQFAELACDGTTALQDEDGEWQLTMALPGGGAQ